MNRISPYLDRRDIDCQQIDNKMEAASVIVVAVLIFGIAGASMVVGFLIGLCF